MFHHHSNFRPRSLRQAIVLATVLGCALPVVAQAADAPASATQSFNIPAQALDSALTQFADQAGLRILFNTRDVAGLRSPGLSGNYLVNEALSHLLQGSGYGFQFVDDKTLTLNKLSAGQRSLELGATSINSTGLESTTEGSDSYTATGPSSTANGLNLSLRETPQSVTVLTRQRMDDENVRSLQDAATTVTGLTYVQVGSERPTFFSRGFSVNNLQYDGVSTGLIVEGALDTMETLSLDNMIIYDRIEVVRGANGLLQGAGNPSAAINLVRKRPTQDFQFSTKVGAGSWDNYSTQLDISGPLSTDGRLRGRAVAYYNDRNSFRDDMGKDNQLIYMISEFDIDESTVLTLGGSAQKDNSGGYDWAGLPYKADGTNYNVSRSTSLQGDWTYLDKTNYQAFAELSHEFSNDWKISAKTNYSWNEAAFLSAYASQYSGDVFSLNYLYQDYETSTRSFNLTSSGPFQLFGRQHELMAGVNYDSADYILKNQGYADQAWTGAEDTVVDIYNPDLSSVTRPTFTTWLKYSGIKLNSTSKGIYSATRLELSDNAKLILGGRISDYSYDGSGVSSSTAENGVFTPYAGIVYALSSNHSVYASYTDIFSPQSVYGTDGARLDPLLGSNYETGLKSEFWNGRLNTSIAAFQIDQENRAAEVSDQPRTCGPAGTSRCYRAVDKVRNRGFEVEASGAVTADWQVGMGYTYSNPVASDGTDVTNFAPKRLFKISTSYQLPGAFNAWKIGGNIHSQSKVSQSLRKQDAYTLLHLRTSYRINENLDVQYSLKNVLDKKYYIYDTTFGEPRNFMVTLNYKM